MSISKDDLLKRKEEIVTDYNNLAAEIEKGETQVKQMKNNLNAVAGALQQVDLFIKQIEEAGDEMPPEKKFALDMATTQENNMAELTQQELNQLSPRAKKAHQASTDLIHETLITNPRSSVVEVEKQEKKKDEKL